MGVERDGWDERHAAAADDEPGPPLRWPEGLAVRTGRALDVACGRGGVAVWAAAGGLEVTALDASPVAVERTAQLANTHGVAGRVTAFVHDLSNGLPVGLGRFGLVVMQRYRDPALVPALTDHLAPDGIIVLTTLSVVGAERSGSHHAPSGELRASVAGFGLEVLVDVEADGLATVIGRRRD